MPCSYFCSICHIYGPLHVGITERILGAVERVPYGCLFLGASCKYRVSIEMVTTKCLTDICMHIGVCVFTSRNFHHPQPQEYLIRECVDRLLAAVDRSLGAPCYKDTVIRIPFSHTVFRYLFHDKTELTLQDFCSTYFPSGWDRCYLQFGFTDKTWRGRCIVFPLKVKCVLRWSRRNSFVRHQNGTFTRKTVILEEILRMTLTKINC